MCHGTYFEGESSFSSHSVQATLSAQTSAGGVQKSHLSSELHQSLASLKPFLEGYTKFSRIDDLTSPNGTVEHSATKAELPPVIACCCCSEKGKVGQNPSHEV